MVCAAARSGKRAGVENLQVVRQFTSTFQKKVYVRFVFSTSGYAVVSAVCKMQKARSYLGTPAFRLWEGWLGANSSTLRLRFLVSYEGQPPRWAQSQGERQLQRCPVLPSQFAVSEPLIN